MRSHPTPTPIGPLRSPRLPLAVLCALAATRPAAALAADAGMASLGTRFTSPPPQGLSQPPEQPRRSRRPDVVVILADDMGFSDIGCYGGEIRTPRLDALAADGVRLRRFYNTGRCCPTRASLLTGLYPHQAGVGHMLAETGLPGYGPGLNEHCVTIAEVLRRAGYGTYMAGKWHVSGPREPSSDTGRWPLQRGFDRFYGTITGAGSFYDPATLCRGNTFITPANDPEYQPEIYYYTDAISDSASRFVREHVEASPDQPLFLYVAYTAAHWPMHALPDDIAAYRGAYDDGYAATRSKRLARLKALGLLREDCELSPAAERWAAVPPPRRAWEARCMEVYAAMVTSMDRGIGRIVDTLQALDRLDNTLILYLQDNGGCAEGFGRRAPNRPYAKYRPLAPDELQRQIWPPMQTRDGRPVRTGPDVMPGAADTFLAYGRGWANVSNTPFREYKHWVHEGGIATPLIAHWPNGIEPSRRGAVEPQVGHLIDVMATALEVADAEYPATRDGHPVPACEGSSLVPALRGERIARPRPLCWEHEANCAIRDGPFKLVRKGSMRDGSQQPWELYDLSTDESELHDLAAAQPERVDAMAASWNAWAMRAQVKPWPWKRTVETFSQQTAFRLAAGATLGRSRAPWIAGRTVTIDIEVAEPGTGVLVAQGGTTDGYAVYLTKDALCLTTRRNGHRARLAAPIPDAGERLRIRAVIRGHGDLELTVGGRTTSRRGRNEPMRMPLDGLAVGRDDDSLVDRAGDGSRAFSGSIEAVEIHLGDA